MGGGLELVELAIGYRLSRGRGRTRVVAEAIRAAATPGELTALLGPNGTGKSTLLRTLAGLQPALAGQILLAGTDLRQLRSIDRARKVAVVLTERVDVGPLSVRELVGLGRHPHTKRSGPLDDTDQEIVGWALEVTRASELADRPVRQLSDGERQRVLIARALAQQPALLLLDEPSAFLDAPSRVALTGLLRGLAREHSLIVVVSTHDVDLALRVADQVWLLDAHGVLRAGPPEQLVAEGHIKPLRRADPADVTAALVALARFGPFFGVHLDQPDNAASSMAERISSVADRLDTQDRRVAASILFQGMAARLWSPVLGCLATVGIVPDLPAPIQWQLRADGGIEPCIPHPGGWLATDDVGDLAALVNRIVIRNVLQPLTDELQAEQPIARGLLWGNVASALVGTLRVLQRGGVGHLGVDDSLTVAVVLRLLHLPPLADTAVLGASGTLAEFRRRSCCLYYRIPGGGLCGDCALTRVGRRVRS